MRAVVQRVSEASVTVAGAVVGSIGRGAVVLVGVGRGDVATDAETLADKVLGMRIFEGEGGGFDRSVTEVDGGLLVVSQFTLNADVRRGRRPSFTAASPPDEAEHLVRAFIGRCRQAGAHVETGRFGSTMSVRLVNEGPATFVVDVAGGKVR